MGKKILIVAAIFFTFLVGCTQKPKDPCEELDTFFMEHNSRKEQPPADIANACSDIMNGEDLLTYLNGKTFKSKEVRDVVDEVKLFAEFMKSQEGKLWRVKCTPKQDTDVRMEGIGTDFKMRLLFIVVEHGWMRNDRLYSPNTHIGFIMESLSKDKTNVPPLSLKQKVGSDFVDVRVLHEDVAINKQHNDRLVKEVFFGDRYQHSFYIKDLPRDAFNIGDYALVYSKDYSWGGTIYLKDIDFSCEDADDATTKKSFMASK